MDPIGRCDEILPGTDSGGFVEGGSDILALPDVITVRFSEADVRALLTDPDGYFADFDAFSACADGAMGQIEKKQAVATRNFVDDAAHTVVDNSDSPSLPRYGHDEGMSASL
ncbi:MAG: hypothetical protein AAB551_00895 [Patescibacteria group bacterium]